MLDVHGGLLAWTVVTFIILLVVVGWFFSGQLNSKKENLKKEPEKSEFNNNIIKVESAILIAEDINQSKEKLVYISLPNSLINLVE